MSDRGRLVLFLGGGALLAFLLLWGSWGLPPFGTHAQPYGGYVASHVMDQRHSTEAVTAVAFDYRGFDTVGEEMIVFVAAVGASILLRHLRQEQERGGRRWRSNRLRNARRTGELVQLAGRFLVAPVIVLGVYVITHGHLSPGGGFQGGVVIATGAFVVLLTAPRLRVSRLLGKEVAEVTHSVGAGGFVAVGLAVLGLGAAFLQNILPLGSTGQLDSAGFIPIVNALVGLEVASALLLIVCELLIEVEDAEMEEQT